MRECGSSQSETDDYLAVLATQSGKHALGEVRRAEFLALVRRPEAHGWPELTAVFVGYLTLGRRREPDSR